MASIPSRPHPSTSDSRSTASQTSSPSVPSIYSTVQGKVQSCSAPLLKKCLKIKYENFSNSQGFGNLNLTKLEANIQNRNRTRLIFRFFRKFLNVSKGSSSFFWYFETESMLHYCHLFHWSVEDYFLFFFQTKLLVQALDTSIKHICFGLLLEIAEFRIVSRNRPEFSCSFALEFFCLKNYSA